jgi:hypothetical protein
MTERIIVPLDDDGLPGAAAIYLAVLAFPERTDWRDDFLMAVFSAAKQPRINARRIAAIDRVGKRIDQRMKAVDIARTVIAGTAASGLHINLRLRGKQRRPFAPTIYKIAETRVGPDNYSNLLGRAWKLSLPVLHLALAFDNHAPKGKSVLALIRDPQWVRPALAAAQVHAAAIDQFIPTAGQRIELIAAD